MLKSQQNWVFGKNLLVLVKTVRKHRRNSFIDFQQKLRLQLRLLYQFLEGVRGCNEQSQKVCSGFFGFVSEVLVQSRSSFYGYFLLIWGYKAKSLQKKKYTSFFHWRTAYYRPQTQRKNNPFGKLQKRFSPSFKNFDFSKEKQHYHRSINYKRDFPPPPHLKFLVSYRKPTL